MNTQITNTVKFMTELLDVLFTFDKVSYWMEENDF